MIIYLCKAIDVGNNLFRTAGAGAMAPVAKTLTDACGNIQFIFYCIKTGVDGIIQPVVLHKGVAHRIVTGAQVFELHTQI